VNDTSKTEPDQAGLTEKRNSQLPRAKLPAFANALEYTSTPPDPNQEIGHVVRKKALQLRASHREQEVVGKGN
jgi:hypothetical protein